MKEKAIFISAILAASLQGLALAAAPAITIRAASDYQKPPTQTANPQAGELLITPTDWKGSVPAEGIDIFFGKDLQDSLKKTSSEKCKDGPTKECTEALTGVLNPQYSIERRFLIAAPSVALLALQYALPALIAAALATILGKAASNNAASVHLASSDIVQLQSQTASSLVYATSSGAPPITVSMTPTPKSTPAAASVTTLTADKDGHHKGDVLITLPTAQAHLLEQLIRKAGAPDKCKNLEKRANSGVPNFGEISDISQFVLPMAAPGQLLDGLGLQANQILPTIVDVRDQAVQLAAAGMTAFAGVEPSLISAISEGVWIATLDICTNLVPDLTELVLEESLITDDPDNDEGKECGQRKDAPLCKDPQCSGNVKGVCDKGDKKGCPCLSLVVPKRYPGTIKFWDESQQVLKDFLDGDGSDSKGELNCDKDHQITLDTSAFTALSKAFCDKTKKVDSMSKGITTKDITAADAGIKGYEGYKFSFKWEKGEGDCSSSCTDIFAAFTASTVCSYDSHTFSSSGSNKVSCGTASFSFSTGEPESTPSPPLDNGEELACGTQGDPGNPNHFASLDSMNHAADYFCQKAMIAKRDFAPGKIPPGQNSLVLNYNHNEYDPIYVSLTYNEAPDCPPLDFGFDGTLQTCKDRLGIVINSCDTSNAKGLMYWKQGGSFSKDCVDWTIKRDEFFGTKPPDDDGWRPTPPTPFCRSNNDCKEMPKCNPQVGIAECQIDAVYSDVGLCSCERNTDCGAPFC